VPRDSEKSRAKACGFGAPIVYWIGYARIEGEAAMKKTGMALAVLAAAALALPSASNARGYRHYARCGLHNDYHYGNVQSPATYLYPAANWGPFFACHMYFGPIYAPLP
jgi:hypothetical protein